jgi:dynein heavy chain
MLSDDIRSQLPEDSKRFETFDQEFKDIMIGASQLSNAVEICVQEARLESLKRLNETVESCEKSLNEYLESKKKSFPRFYFVANQALLDILSNGNKPKVVAQYLGDCFDGIKTLNFEKSEDGKIASGLYSKDSEYVPFHDDIVLEGAVETYLLNLEKHVRLQLRDIVENARQSADNWEVDKPRDIWLQDYCAQLALLTTQMVWTEETARAFDELEGGSKTVMKDYKRVCDDRIEKLIKQSQLRFYWQQKPQSNSLVSFTPDNLKTCVIRICDWSTIYAYEYISNCGRLVITPLTDRCYITLTQALNLVMGGAPAGPAVTGKVSFVWSSGS